MLSPKPANNRTRPKEKADDDWAWRSDELTEDDAECELCQDRSNTSLEYGMRVCPVCDEKLLP